MPQQPKRGSQRPNLIIAAALFALLLILGAQAPAGNQNGIPPHEQIIGGPSKAVVDAGEVTAQITLSSAHTLAGQRVGVIIDFSIAPGWHVYGKPLPEEYTPTTVNFDGELLSGQKFDFPKPTPVKFELLGETLPVYQGRFRAAGDLFLRPKLIPGERRLSGTVSFQECNDNLCKIPQQVRFELPLRIDSPPISPG